MKTAVLISADAEWEAIRRIYPAGEYRDSPFGEWFNLNLSPAWQGEPVIIFQSGWGKIAAAAATQYIIDRWSPGLLIHFGTCGGFEGEVQNGEFILAEKTIVYDIVEQIGDQDSAIAHYTADLDLTWLREPLPLPVRRSIMISADRDLLADQVRGLKEKYGAIAGDWESGAVAYAATKNRTRCLVVKGVSDLVGSRGGEVYGDLTGYAERTYSIMKKLMDSLPGWLL